jgi:hypothetical protein
MQRTIVSFDWCSIPVTAFFGWLQYAPIFAEKTQNFISVVSALIMIEATITGSATHSCP